MIANIAESIKRLLGYMSQVRRHLLGSIVAMALSSLMATWMIADLLGNGMEAIQSGKTAALWYAVGSAVPWMTCILALNVIGTYLSGVATAKSIAAMRGHMLEIMIHAPLETSHSSHSGTKLSLFTNDIPAAIDSVIITLSALISGLFIGIVAFIYVIRIHWIIAAIASAIGIFTYIYSIYCKMASLPGGQDSGIIGCTGRPHEGPSGWYGHIPSVWHGEKAGGQHAECVF